MLGAIFLQVDELLAERARALDRHRPDAPPVAREEELRRRRDDRPVLADERPWVERPQRREGSRERADLAVERRFEVLDEIHLVDVTARDRGVHVVDRRRICLRRPARCPLAYGEFGHVRGTVPGAWPDLTG